MTELSLFFLQPLFLKMHSSKGQKRPEPLFVSIKRSLVVIVIDTLQYYDLYGKFSFFVVLKRAERGEEKGGRCFFLVLARGFYQCSPTEFLGFIHSKLFLFVVVLFCCEIGGRNSQIIIIIVNILLIVCLIRFWWNTVDGFCQSQHFS